ncbi:NHL repeat-containing protein [Nocardia macrotermitis]|uniref:hypothetical protein n=1 Tax=Nocardia macrotermitis TaxID=2585198 RepID=UPI001D0FB8A8|nr:hypothetical protein [Nocardia macrotermitis]
MVVRPVWSPVPRAEGLALSPDHRAVCTDDLLTGAIYRFDPATGRSCAIVTGLSGGWTGPSSVRIAPDGNRWALYVTGFDGTLRRVRPPAGVNLKPVVGVR